MGTATVKVGTLGGATVSYTVKAPTTTARFPGDPGKGKMLFGQSINGNDPSSRELYYGDGKSVYFRVGVNRSYWQATQTSGLVARAKADLAVGRRPLVSTKLPATWAAVANGSQDAWLKTLMSGLGGLAGASWLCFHHEPTDDTGTGMQAADYAAMYRQAKKYKPANVALVPILQSAPFDPTVGGSGDPTPWYAADAIDVVGIDSYCHWYPGGTNRWREPNVTFGGMLDKCKALGKPMLVAEYGVRTDPANPGKAAKWMHDAYNYLLGRGDVVAMSFFDQDQNVNDGGTPWTLDYGGTERLVAFRDILRAS